MPAATAHATIRHDASGLQTARAHVAHLFVTIGRLLSHLLCTFCVRSKCDTDYLVGCFWCSFADSECAFCAGCQLRLRMLRSGMMHRGCGQPVRTLHTFSYDRAAPSAPVLYLLCAKQMTPIMLACFVVLLCWFGVRFLRWMPAATAHGTIRHHASGLRAARAHVAHVAHPFLRSGGS